MSGVLASATPGNATALTINGGQKKLSGTAVGHFTVQSTWDSLFDVSGPLSGWAGQIVEIQPPQGTLFVFQPETAGNRFKRLCSEEGIAFRGRGNLDATVPMGAADPRNPHSAAAGMRRR